MSDDKKTIYAQAILMSPSGKSITDKPASSGNISELLPSAQTKKTITAYLEKKGFKINTDGPSLAVSGKKGLFEKVFSCAIKVNSKNGQEFFTAVTQPIIPPELQHLLKEIVFSEPVEYFG